LLVLVLSFVVWAGQYNKKAGKMKQAKVKKGKKHHLS
jgi:hypothetical protein